jgi:hypothetical protein
MLAKHGIVCLVALLGVAGCEHRALGRMCVALPGAPDGLAGDSGIVINDRALECRTQLCLQQAPDPATAHAVDTAALCTADCRRDSDCEDGELRESERSGDRRCRSGFFCGVALSTGTVAPCRRLCLCRDFATAPVAVPPTCAGR